MSNPTYTLTDNAGGKFSLSGNQVVTAAAIPAGNYQIGVRSTDQYGWSKDFTLTVPIYEGQAAVGDLVFGPQADTGSVVCPGMTPNTTQKDLCGSTYLPDLPANWRAVFWNFWSIGNGSSPVEVKPGNTNELKWLSVLPSISGARVAGGDATFADFGGGSGVMADGGFMITDALPAVSAGAYARWLLETPTGGKRPNGYGLNYNARGQIADCGSAASQFDAVRAGGALGNPGDGSVFNNEATQMAGLLVPRTAGYRSFNMFGTSIMRGQNSEQRYLLSVDAVRNVYAYLPIALDNATYGRMGWCQWSINGARIENQSDVSSGSLSYELRYKVLKAIAAKNGGRWPFTDIIVDFRNDAVLSDGLPDVASTVADMQFRITTGLAKIKAMFPGLPVHVVTLPPIQSGASPAAAAYGTSLAAQVPATGNFKSAAVVIVNDWLRSSYAALGFASVCDIAADMVTIDNGIAKWPTTPFTGAGGGVISAADYPSGLPSATNLSSTGVKLTCPVGYTPEVGNFLVFDATDASNIELIGGTITSVALVSGNTYLVKVSAGNTAKAHAAGGIVRTTCTPDLTHPSKWLQDKTGTNSALAWKGTI